MKNLCRISLFAALIFGSPSLAHAADAAKAKSVVLVHGAFADGSSWNKVIPLLERKGLHAVAVQNPLTSLHDDVEATRRAIEQQSGPVVLVGHSWGGVVITQAGLHEKVKALVYIAAFAPDAGQSVSDLLKGLPEPVWLSSLKKDSGGFLTLTMDAILQHFAQDLPPAEGRLIASTQGPPSSRCFDEKVSDSAWRSKPSWTVVTEQDHMISPSLQQSMAKRINAKIVKVNASHVVMLSKPEQVAAAIIAAAETVH